MAVATIVLGCCALYLFARWQGRNLSENWRSPCQCEDFWPWPPYA